jgi:ribonuclease-3
MMNSKSSDPGILAESLGLERVELLEQALTHPENRRLAWLGDAVLYLAMTEHLYTASKAPASRMDPRRQETIRNLTLKKTAAEKLHLSEYIRVPSSERDPNAERILATAFEALIGAIFSEKGYQTAASFVVDLFTTIRPK